MSEQLNQIEAILKITADIARQNTQAIAENAQAIAENNQAIAENAQTIAENNQAIADSSQSREELRRSFSGMQQSLMAMTSTQIEILKRIDATQSEIKGMQVENRRILDHLFGET